MVRKFEGPAGAMTARQKPLVSPRLPPLVYEGWNRSIRWSTSASHWSLKWKWNQSIFPQLFECWWEHGNGHQWNQTKSASKPKRLTRRHWPVLGRKAASSGLVRWPSQPKAAGWTWKASQTRFFWPLNVFQNKSCNKKCWGAKRGHPFPTGWRYPTNK